MASSLNNLIGQTLTWVPTAALKARYDLTTPEGETLASLDMSNWNSKAHAVVPAGTLFMRREGWSGSKVSISAAEQGPLIATYRRKWSGTSGQLQFSNGREFKWGKINFWGTQKAWMDPTGAITYVRLSAGSFSRKSTVVIEAQGAEVPELSLLVVLGLYNILIERRDAAAVSASVSVSV